MSSGSINQSHNFSNNGAHEIINLYQSSDSIDIQSSSEIKTFLEFMGYKTQFVDIDPTIPYNRLFVDTYKDGSPLIMIGKPLITVLDNMSISELQNLSSRMVPDHFGSVDAKSLQDTQAEVKGNLVKKLIDINRHYREKSLGLDNISPLGNPTDLHIINNIPNVNSEIYISTPRTDYRIREIIPASSYFPKKFVNVLEAVSQVRSDDSNIIERLMVTNENTLKSIANYLGFVDFIGSKADAIDLIWWYYIMLPPMSDSVSMLQFRLNPDQISYIMSLDLARLQQYCNLQSDRTTCLFLLITGFLPNIPDIQRDNTATDLNTNMYTDMKGIDVMRLSRFLYNYYDDFNYSVSPYRLLAINNIKLQNINKFLLNITATNVDSVAEELGMTFPTYLDESSYSQLKLPNDRIIYFLDNIKYYKYVFEYNFVDFDYSDPLKISHHLTFMRDDHIFKKYNVLLVKWSSRPNLIEQVVKELTWRSDHWTYRYENCNGNILSYGKSILTNKHNSGHTLDSSEKSYKCYTVKQLLDNFYEEPTSFRFNKPGENGQFSFSSLRQLLNLLKTQQVLPEILSDQLINRINYGMGISFENLEAIKYNFSKFHQENKKKIYSYVDHLYNFSRYLISSDSCIPQGFISNQSMSETFSISKAFEEYKKLTHILDQLPPDAQSWVENIPTVSYDSFNNPVFHDISLHEIIVSGITGSLCSSVVREYIKSATIYTGLNVFDWSIDHFNDFDLKMTIK